MHPFVHVHSSSRYDRSAASLSEAMDFYTELADIVTLTEVAREHRERALKKPGFTVVTGDKTGWDDCAVVFDNKRFKLVYEESYNMGGTGRYSKIVVLDDLLAKKRLVYSAVHDPASVETELAAGRRTGDSIMWTKAVVGHRNRMNYLRRKYKARAAFISSDWNINLKRLWARTLLKSIHPRWTLAWKAPWPVGGTHFSRLIDGTLFRGAVKLARKARLLRDDDSSDHRPYVETFEWV